MHFVRVGGEKRERIKMNILRGLERSRVEGGVVALHSCFPVFTLEVLVFGF